MKKKDKQNDENGTALPLPSSSDLRGKQSMRATFKLTGKAIDAISVVSAQLGIKQKSLFDHLIDDIQTLNLIALNINQNSFNTLNRIQKTYVISRRTLVCLEEASKNFNAPRDALVEYSIQRLLPVIAEEREKHQKRKEILSEITDYIEKGEKIRQKSRKLLGEDDPIYEKFETAMTAFHTMHNHIKTFVEKGKIIEDF